MRRTLLAGFRLACLACRLGQSRLGRRLQAFWCEACWPEGQARLVLAARSPLFTARMPPCAACACTCWHPASSSQPRPHRSLVSPSPLQPLLSLPDLTSLTNLPDELTSLQVSRSSAVTATCPAAHRSTSAVGEAARVLVPEARDQSCRLTAKQSLSCAPGVNAAAAGPRCARCHHRPRLHQLCWNAEKKAGRASPIHDPTPPKKGRACQPHPRPNSPKPSAVACLPPRGPTRLQSSVGQLLPVKDNLVNLATSMTDLQVSPVHLGGWAPGSCLCRKFRCG